MPDNRGQETLVTPARGASVVSAVQWSIDACRHPISRLQREIARADRYDLAAALVFAALLALVGFTFIDYAISNDEEVQQHYGELIVAYYLSGLTDQALFHFRNLYLYGGLFDIIAVGLEKLIPLDPYAVRHLFSALTGVGSIAAVWATARAIGGSRAGLLAAVALAVCGTWYGAMFNHTKDIPFAAAMMGALYLLVLIGRELPRPRWRLVMTFGVLCGCALGIRVLGLFLLTSVGLVLVLHAPMGRGFVWRQMLVFAARSTLALLPAFVIAYAIMVAAWPYAALAPLNPLRAMTTFVDFNYPVRTILAGHVYYMADVPRWYVPTYVAIKLTLWLLFGAALAIVFASLPRRFARSTDSLWRKETAVIAFGAFLPPICEAIVDGPAFSGMRHFLFIVPPIAVLAGLGLSGLLLRLESFSRLAVAGAVAFVALGLSWNATTLYRLHPDEYLFYNPLVGGLAGASRSYDTDYWVNTMPEAMADLKHFIDRVERTSGKKKRRYLVAACSERLQFEKEADARLEWTRDFRRADFFVAPTHMNCDRTLNGRVIATVERLDVVIGVVKDRRAVVERSVAGLN